MFQKCLLIVCLAIWLPSLAQAAKRMGLVIGNDNYAHVPVLEKARNDAEAITDSLSGLGFEITEVLDANRREMNRAIARFTAKLQPGDTALVFFAGHGVEIDGENYLLPVDIEAPTAASEDFIKFESIGLSDILFRVQSTGARTTLMFIDACRDNPFAQAGGRSIGGSRGLGRVLAPEGTFVVFSAGAHQQALDRLSGPDADPNSIFTRTLLPKLTEPGLELRELVSDVRLQVRDIALTQNHRQFPAYYDELLGEFYFTASASSAPAVANTEPSVGQSADDALETDFARARSLGSVAAYEAFLERHEGKDDLVITIAMRELQRLRIEITPIAPDPTPVPDTQAQQAEPAVLSRRDIIRLSQQKLNALGCSAGGADGVSGPRTRSAFQAFITATGARLSPSDLGTQAALDQLNARSGTICAPAARQTQPVTEATAPTPEAAPQTSAPQQSSLAGTWRFSAKCPLFIRANGVTRYKSIGGNRYALSTSDNLGNTATGTMTDLGGGTIKVSAKWQNGASDNYNAKLSADRSTITGINNAGCRFTARR